MTFDTSSTAINEDLTMAESAGVPRGQIALVRAQIRATLAVLNSPQIQQYSTTLESRTPAPETWQERITAAAELVGWDPDELAALVSKLDNNPDPQDEPSAPVLDNDPEDSLDADFDVFEEARKARKK